MRITIAKVPRCRKTLTRKRARSGTEYEKSQAPCSLSALSAVSLPRISSPAIRAVSCGRSIGSCGMSTAVRCPDRSTCGGRPGEKTRSLIPFPESSIAMISVGVAIGDAAAALSGSVACGGGALVVITAG
jgi:hypothetical protein